MKKNNIYNERAEQIGEIKLSDKIFGVKKNESLVHQAVVAQMGNERQVLAHTKDRSEVRGGGKKPWKQKGTGRARAGSSRSPIWIGGGVTFGPLKERNFRKKINKKMKQKALSIVFSDKISNNNFTILEKFEINEFKTKKINEIIENIEKKVFKETKNKKRSILIINDIKDEKTKYSIRNLKGVKNININNINIIDILKYKKIIITKKSVEKLEKQYK